MSGHRRRVVDPSGAAEIERADEIQPRLAKTATNGDVPVGVAQHSLKGVGLAVDGEHVPIGRDEFQEEYWNRLWNWYEDGGIGHVAAYLAQYDLSEFNPKAPPSKTEAFWHIVDASRAPEDSELADILEALYWPDAVTTPMIIDLHTHSWTSLDH